MAKGVGGAANRGGGRGEGLWRPRRCVVLVPLADDFLLSVGVASTEIITSPAKPAYSDTFFLNLNSIYKS